MIFSKLAVFVFRTYQIIVSPLIGKNCRFVPSCSNYAIESFREYDFFRACFFTIKRLSKCHPFHPGGFDELPIKTSKTTCCLE